MKFLSRLYTSLNDSSFDRYSAGAVTENLALQGFSMGLVVHGMEGFDYDRAKKELGLPEEYQVEALFAVGKPGPLSVLSEELQEWEKPSGRKPISAFAFKGSFGKKIF